MLLFEFVPPFLSPAVSTNPFFTSVSVFLLCRWVHQDHFSKFDTCVSIYSISFSLSVLLHSAKQALGSPTWLKLIQIHSISLLSNFHSVYLARLLYPFICQQTSRVLPCPQHCTWCCSEHWGTRVVLNYGFQTVRPVVGLQGHTVFLSLGFRESPYCYP